MCIVLYYGVMLHHTMVSASTPPLRAPPCGPAASRCPGPERTPPARSASAESAAEYNIIQYNIT